MKANKWVADIRYNNFRRFHFEINCVNIERNNANIVSNYFPSPFASLLPKRLEKLKQFMKMSETREISIPSFFCAYNFSHGCNEILFQPQIWKNIFNNTAADGGIIFFLSNSPSFFIVAFAHGFPQFSFCFLRLTVKHFKSLFFAPHCHNKHEAMRTNEKKWLKTKTTTGKVFSFSCDFCFVSKKVSLQG